MDNEINRLRREAEADPYNFELVSKLRHALSRIHGNVPDCQRCGSKVFMEPGFVSRTNHATLPNHNIEAVYWRERRTYAGPAHNRYASARLNGWRCRVCQIVVFKLSEDTPAKFDEPYMRTFDEEEYGESGIAWEWKRQTY